VYSHSTAPSAVRAPLSNSPIVNTRKEQAQGQKSQQKQGLRRKEQRITSAAAKNPAKTIGALEAHMPPDFAINTPPSR
jgi:hypothetical protein